MTFCVKLRFDIVANQKALGTKYLPNTGWFYLYFSSNICRNKVICKIACEASPLKIFLFWTLEQ